jgi:hypothetical protein
MNYFGVFTLGIVVGSADWYSTQQISFSDHNVCVCVCVISLIV